MQLHCRTIHLRAWCSFAAACPDLGSRHLHFWPGCAWNWTDHPDESSSDVRTLDINRYQHDINYQNLFYYNVLFTIWFIDSSWFSMPVPVAELSPPQLPGWCRSTHFPWIWVFAWQTACARWAVLKSMLKSWCLREIHQFTFQNGETCH